MLQALKGITYLTQGIRLLPRPGIRRYVIAPFALNLLVFGAWTALGLREIGGWTDRLMAELPGWLQWLEWLLWPLFVLTLLAAGFLICLMLVNVLAAPFTGPLAAAVEAHLGHHAPESGGLLALLKEAQRSVVSEIRKLLYFTLRALPLLLLFLLPVINVIAAPAWLLFGIWMLALEFAEVPLGNHGLDFAQVRRAAAGRKLLLLGFGAAAFVLALIPIVNFVAVPAAVAGATVMIAKEGIGRETSQR